MLKRSAGHSGYGSPPGLVVCLVCLLALPGASQASDSPEFYTALGVRQVHWNALTVDRTDAIDFDANLHTTADFSVRTGNNLFVGLLIDLDSKEERNRRIAGRLGFGDWGILLEKGAITGRFASDDDLAFQPQPGEFEEDYLYLAVYKSGRWFGGASQSGVGYAAWTLPRLSYVNHEASTRAEFVDPATKFEALGYFLKFDQLRAVTAGNRRPGFNLETQVLIGIASMTPSDSEVDRVAAITGRRPDTDRRLGFGGISEFRVGYFGRIMDADRLTLGFSAGYEARLFGFYLEFDDPVSDQHQIFSEGMEIYHGPFLTVAGSW